MAPRCNVAAKLWSKRMKKKRAAEQGFKCRYCGEALHNISSSEYGCLNDSCYENYYVVAYRVKLKLVPKNRL